MPVADKDAAAVDAAPRLPRSFLACLPLLWSNVLFPGSTAERQPLRWRSLAMLLILPGALLYPCLTFLLFEPDEGRYAEIPREMLARGEWIVPYLQSEPYLDKPPLFYWLVMGSYRLFGVHDWAARLVPALAVHAAILLTYLLGRRRLGDRAALWGALVLGLAPGFLSVGRLLVLDGLLTLWALVSLLAAEEATSGPRLRWGWWLLAALACALGVLTKGPVALALLFPPLLAARWLTGARCRIGGMGYTAFLCVVLALCLPWYVAVSNRLPEFAGYFLWRHNVMRFLTPFDHQEPIWFYGPILLAGLFPASLLGVAWVRFLLSGDPMTAARRSPALGFLVLAGGWCVLFFTLAGSKLPTYILPAFPPLALVLGHYIATSGWSSSRWVRGGAVVTVLLLAAAHYVGVPWYARFHSPMSRPDVIVAQCGDRRTPVVCYPRNCDSVAFYVGRDDFRSFRSKETAALLVYLQQRPRTVLLFTHRHSPEGLRELLPAGLHLTGLTPISKNWVSFLQPGYCYLGVVEHQAPPR